MIYLLYLLIFLLGIFLSTRSRFYKKYIDYANDSNLNNKKYKEPVCDVTDLIEYLKKEFKESKLSDEKRWSITIEVSKRGTVRKFRLNQLDEVTQRPELKLTPEQYLKANASIKVISTAYYENKPVNGLYYQYLGDIFND